MKEKIEELELKISQETEKCKEILIKGESFKSECIPLILQEIKEQILKEIERFVETDVKNTNKLGLKNLSGMKKEMNELIKDVDNLEVNGMWLISLDFIKGVDFNKDTFNITYDKSNEIQQNVRNFVKNQLLRIADILIKYGYVDENNKNEHHIFNSHFGISLSDNLYNKIKVYSESFKEYVRSNERLFKLQKELEQTNALYLWEQA
ncbi:hypothetical protein [Clostridium botulinum]|uniref:hypothetical protein n=1 Tax=Clostridium botulinum TaxID=1491 RepID=UPI001C9A3A43|nr:hypothetical protein [Clostridium botulinum]MBY6838725.1 hypothetical protein [Clostridium botulinum]